MTANIGQLLCFSLGKSVTAHKFTVEWTQLSRQLSRKYSVVTSSVCVCVCARARVLQCHQVQE
jgi:hypothetical protein